MNKFDQDRVTRAEFVDAEMVKGGGSAGAAKDKKVEIAEENKELEFKPEDMISDEEKKQIMQFKRRI